MESVIFKRNDMIAVLGENKEFWLCKSLQNASFSRKKSPFFKALWLERDGTESTYTMQSEPNSVPFDSIICKIRLKKLKLSTNGIFELPSRTKMKLDRFVNNFTKGIVLNSVKCGSLYGCFHDVLVWSYVIIIHQIYLLDVSSLGFIL